MAESDLFTLHAVNLGDQLTLSAAEGIAHRKMKVSMALIGIRGARNIDLPAVRQFQPDRHEKGRALAVVPVRSLDGHPAGNDAAKPALKLTDVPFDQGPLRVRALKAEEIHLYGGLHEAVLSCCFRFIIFDCEGLLLDHDQGRGGLWQVKEA